MRQFHQGLPHGFYTNFGNGQPALLLFHLMTSQWCKLTSDDGENGLDTAALQRFNPTVAMPRPECMATKS